MTDLYRQGIEYFNAGYFFEAHDTFEELWMDDRDESKRFFQGLVQISTGYYHLVMKNLKGAESQLTKGTEKLAPYEPSYQNLNVANLISTVHECLAVIKETKEEPPWPKLVELIPKLQLENNGKD